MNAKKKMCGDKSTFYSKQRAETHAAKYGQRIYECPVCFCWHCTSKANWKDDFITAEVMRKALAKQKTELRTEFNVALREKNKRIAEMELELSRATDGEGNDK